MKKCLVIALFIGALFLTGCEEKEQKQKKPVSLKTVEEKERTKPLTVEMKLEKNLPFLVWEKETGDHWYEVYIIKSTQHRELYLKTEKNTAPVLPGKRLRYQVVAVDRKGRQIQERTSNPKEFIYRVKGEKGGMLFWKRPDHFESYSSANSFPKGLYWDPLLAQEIKMWLVETYKKDYLLGGHVEEFDEKTGHWIAPISPLERKNGQRKGYGLDCVGFVNGFYYAYSMALAGEKYYVMDQLMENTCGVYGSEFTPLGYAGFQQEYVIKPVLKGNYADFSHIRPGDINESEDHVWIVSHQGSEMNSRIWEYEHIKGFNDERVLKDLEKEDIRHPYGYWICGIANPLESYSELLVEAVDEKGNPVTGGEYQLKDTLKRTLAMEKSENGYRLYRPKGDEFFFHLFDEKGETPQFYDEKSSFTLIKDRVKLERVIGGRYILYEVKAPKGYKKRDIVGFNIDPGEKKVLKLTYQTQ